MGLLIWLHENVATACFAPMKSDPTEIAIGMRRHAEPPDAHGRATKQAAVPAGLSAEVMRLETEVFRLQAQLNMLEPELKAIQREHKLLLASSSWRLTRPLRLLSRGLPELATYARRVFGPLRLPRKAGGEEGVRVVCQHVEDLATLRSDAMFDADMYLPLDRTRTGAIVDFLTRWAVDEETLQAGDNVFRRRPCAGFHPQIYAHAHAGAYDTRAVNPLAHFIRSGKPDGPWRHDVITPASPIRASEGRDIPPTALHAHLHYPELAEDFLGKISSTGARCDLLLSANGAGNAEIIRNAASQYGRGEVQIRVVPNRGRDIGAFLTGFGDDIVARYEIVGHMHGKRSLQGGGGFDPYFGERWREFLWQNLVGDQHPMMDIVIERLAADDKLGIVFPEDPYLYHWDANRPIAEGLAARMGISEPLPAFFDFPIGTMFWARTAALKPLFNLKLGWEDYPQEPVAHDGTILNAIERLLPFVARQTGYRFATTQVPGVTR
jgi:hypothetical protein